MKTSAHSIISGSIAISLGVFTAFSAIFVGLAASTTIASVSLFVALGMIEIAVLSYSSPHAALNDSRRASTVRATSVIVAFPTPAAQRKAA